MTPEQEQLLVSLRSLWTVRPDLRFGQLLTFAMELHDEGCPTHDGPCLYTLGDVKLTRMVESTERYLRKD